MLENIKRYGQWLYDRTCKGKIAYDKIVDAERAVRKMRKSLGGKPFNHYRCRFCGAIHVGHRSRRPNQDYEFQ